MAHALTVVPLRIGLRVLRLAQPALPRREAAALARAARLRLTPSERPAEAAIDALRRRLITSTETVEVDDSETPSGQPVRRISEVARRTTVGPAWGRFLFGLVRALQPHRVLELGTGLGVGSAHLAQALCVNEEEGEALARLVTLEAAPVLAARAAGSLARLGHSVGDEPECRVRVVVGPLAETLVPTAEAEGPFGLVVIDGRHEEDAVLAHVKTLRSHLAPGAVLALGGVAPRGPVRGAWRRLREAQPEPPAFYAGRYGLFFAGAPHASEGAATAVARETGSNRPPVGA